MTSAENTLEKWHAMVRAGEFSALPEILHPDAVFRSPMAHTPYKSAMAVCIAINAVSTVFEVFTYHRQFWSEDGLSVVLEFSARIGEKSLKGIDLLTFNEDGQITEFEVMIRPMSGLQALGVEMALKAGPALANMKAGSV